MVVKYGDRRCDRRANMRDGDGVVELGAFFSGNELPEHARLISEIRLEDGCSIGSHAHNGEYELFYILEGTATYDDNGHEVKLYPGDVSLCRDGETHGIANRDGGVVRLFAVIITV